MMVARRTWVPSRKLGCAELKSSARDRSGYLFESLESFSIQLKYAVNHTSPLIRLPQPAAPAYAAKGLRPARYGFNSCKMFAMNITKPSSNKTNHV